MTSGIEMGSLSEESEPPGSIGWKLDGIGNATVWEWAIKVMLRKLGVAGPFLLLSGSVMSSKPSICMGYPFRF